MATIYLDVPTYVPDTVVVKQATTIDGTKTEVVNTSYGGLSIDGGKVLVTHANIDTTKYAFVYYVYNTIGTVGPLVIDPVGSLVITLQSLFNKSLSRLSYEPPIRDFMSTASHVIDYIDRRLFELGSDLILYDQTASLAIDAFQTKLPFGMLGIAEHPSISYTNCTKATLEPLVEDDRHTFTETGIPQYYEVRRGSLNVYPTCDRAVTLKYATYLKSRCDEMTDPVPYEGLFNDVIVELVVKFGSNPMLMVDGVIEAAVEQAIDRVVNYRTPKTVAWRYNL